VVHRCGILCTWSEITFVGSTILYATSGTTTDKAVHIVVMTRAGPDVDRPYSTDEVKNFLRQQIAKVKVQGERDLSYMRSHLTFAVLGGNHTVLSMKAVTSAIADGDRGIISAVYTVSACGN
jgi:hypothetical protein